MPEEARDPSLPRKIAKSGSLVFGGRMLELFVSFVGAAIIARLIGPTDFGSITIGRALLSTIGSLVLLGLGTGIARHLPRYDDVGDRRGVLVSAFQLSIPVAVVVAVALLLGADWLAGTVFDDRDVAPVLRIFALGIPLSAVTDLGIAAAKGNTDTLPQVYAKNLSIPITRIALAAVVLVLAPTAPMIAWAYTLAYAVSAGLIVWYLWRHTELLSDVAYTPMRRKLLVFSMPLAFSGLMMQLLSDLDTFLLGAFVKTSEVGIYGVVYPLAGLMMVFTTSVNYLAIPLLSDLHSEAKHDEMARLFGLTTKWATLSTLPVFLGFLMFPRQVILLTYGDQYVDGALALSVLAAGFLVNVAVGPTKSLLASIGHTKSIMWGTVFAATLNIGLNLILIPQYSYVGAAVATAISYAVLHAYYVAQLYRTVGVHPIRRSILRPAIATIGVATIGFLVLRDLLRITPLVAIAASILFLPIYGVLLLRLGGVGPDEIQILLDIEHKLGVDLGPLKRLVERFME